MKKHYFLVTFLLLLVFAIFLSCGSDESDEYKEVSPVVMDLTTVPYPKLSDYKFFVGDMKNLEPAYKVLPYDLNSSLFTDYALKKRFVWMPEGSKATYSADGEVLNFPTGAVLIKTFYYENTLPDNTTGLIETRLMIKKADGWIFATYVWNAEQTDALLDMAGSNRRVRWMQDDTQQVINYRIPAAFECAICHKLNNTAIPIGVKPQNLDKMHVYAEGARNQLEQWKKEGYLNIVPSSVNATVDWTDTSKSLNLRARSYLDINCAHCHRPGGDCGNMPLILTFNQTTDPVNLGICVEPHDFVTGTQRYLVSGQNIDDSLLYFRMSTDISSEMMPQLGKTLIHTEAAQLMADWINSLEQPCP